MRRALIFLFAALLSVASLASVGKPGWIVEQGYLFPVNGLAKLSPQDIEKARRASLKFAMFRGCKMPEDYRVKESDLIRDASDVFEHFPAETEFVLLDPASSSDSPTIPFRGMVFKPTTMTVGDIRIMVTLPEFEESSRFAEDSLRFCRALDEKIKGMPHVRDPLLYLQSRHADAVKCLDAVNERLKVLKLGIQIAGGPAGSSNPTPLPSEALKESYWKAMKAANMSQIREEIRILQQIYRNITQSEAFPCGMSSGNIFPFLDRIKLYTLLLEDCIREKQHTEEEKLKYVREIEQYDCDVEQHAMELLQNVAQRSLPSAGDLESLKETFERYNGKCKELTELRNGLFACLSERSCTEAEVTVPADLFRSKAVEVPAFYDTSFMLVCNELNELFAELELKPSDPSAAQVRTRIRIRETSLCYRIVQMRKLVEIQRAHYERLIECASCFELYDRANCASFNAYPSYLGETCVHPLTLEEIAVHHVRRNLGSILKRSAIMSNSYSLLCNALIKQRRIEDLMKKHNIQVYRAIN